MGRREEGLNAAGMMAWASLPPNSLIAAAKFSLLFSILFFIFFLFFILFFPSFEAEGIGSVSVRYLVRYSIMYLHTGRSYDRLYLSRVLRCRVLYVFYSMVSCTWVCIVEYST